MFFQQIFEKKLAQYAYLIGCQKTGEAIVVDPMRDIERYEQIAANNKLKIVAAVDTHIHADYLTGMREFAEKGVHVYASDEGGSDWKYEWLAGSGYNYTFLYDGSEFNIGNIKFKAVYTPGHTPEHLSYLVTDGAVTDQPMGMLSGDFIFVGDVGRPDLLETAAGQVGVMESSARVLYQSIKKFQTFPEYLQLWPGHGAGSACGKALGTVPDSTVGYEQRFNGSVKAATSEQNFVEFILDGQPEPPLYFSRMKRDNKSGPRVLGDDIPLPKRISVPDFILDAQAGNTIILDTRSNSEFMHGHIAGSLHAPLNRSFNTIAGCYVQEDELIYLIAHHSKIEETVLDLIRIGLDNCVAYITPQDLIDYWESGCELTHTETITFDDVDELLNSGTYTLLDVRKKTEFNEGHHPDAVNIAHTRLAERMCELPKDIPVLVHCQSGGRASSAASVLEREGFSVKYVDDLVEPWLKKHQWLPVMQ